MAVASQVLVLNYGSSKTNSGYTLSVDGPCEIDYIVVNWSGSVSTTVTITIEAGLGSEFDATLPSLAFDSNSNGVYIPDGGSLRLTEGDTLVVAAEAVSSRFSSVAIYGRGEA